MKKFLAFSFLILNFAVANAKIDKVRLLFNGSTNSFTLIWEQVSGKAPVVFIDDSLAYANTGKLAHAVKSYKHLKFFKMETYYVSLKDLAENRLYYIVIKDSEDESELFWFKTLPKNPQRLSIIGGGDSRTNPDIRRAANKMVAKLQPDFVIFDGDFTEDSNAKQIQQWLDDWQLTIKDGRLIPIVPAMGNHEKGKIMPNVFDIPANSYYSLNFGNLLHLSILNTTIKIEGEQTQWLEKDLENAQDKIWRMAVFHKPMRPHYSKKREGNDIYNAWAGLFFDKKVQLILEGDTHVCKVTYPIRPAQDSTADEGFVRDDENGSVYIGEGTWGAPLRKADDLKSWTLDAAAINQFKWIFIDKNNVEIRTIKYENVDKVKGLSYYDRFVVPDDLDFWLAKGKIAVTVSQ